MTKDGNSGPKLPVQQLAILAVARFAEPIAYTSIYPYLPDMIRSFGVAENDIATWAGLTSGAFSLAQSITAVPWSRAADRYGRKPTLIIGLLSTMVCFVVWSFSRSLAMAITVRVIQGGSNGNIGIIRTMVAEMVPQKELQPRAFSVMPLVWSLGSVIGPAFGGFFAKPAERFPGLFGGIPFFTTFPYALPNLLATVFFLISVCSAAFFLKETLEAKRDRSDWGILVGQRLTRAFSRKTGRNGRTSSFVDGEATAPLVPSRPLTPGAAGKPAALSEIFTYQTVIALIAYSFLAFHSVAYDQNISVFLSTPVAPRTPDNYHPPFYFNGGFGLDPGTIGTIFTIYGITSAAVQFLLYPALVARYGVLRTFHVCSVLLPFIYCATPFTSLFATEQGRFIAIIGIMVLKACCIIIAFPSTTILLTNSCVSLRVLSSINGFATMFSAFCRAIGPAATGRVFSWGADHGYIVSAYFFLGASALLGALPAFLIVEGDGPTAGAVAAAAAAAAAENDDERASSQSVSPQSGGAALLPNESAIVGSDDEDADERRPLISHRRNGDTEYRSITGQ